MVVSCCHCATTNISSLVSAEGLQEMKICEQFVVARTCTVAGVLLFPLVVDVGQIVGCQVIGSRGSRVPPGPPVHIIAFFLSHTAQQSTELQTNIDQE